MAAGDDRQRRGQGDRERQRGEMRRAEQDEGRHVISGRPSYRRAAIFAPALRSARA
jgi:hypothetical protein